MGTIIKNGVNYLGEKQPHLLSELTNDVGFITDADKSSISSIDGSVSVPNNAHTTVCSFECKKDKKYIFIGLVRFANNATGYRHLYVNANESTTASGHLYNSIANAINGTYTYVTLTIAFNSAADSTYYLRAFQNSGADMNSLYYRCKLIEIGSGV